MLAVNHHPKHPNPFAFLRRIFKRKRAYERSPRNVKVQLFSEAGLLGSADLVDESEGGAKVALQSPFILEHAVFLLNPATATAHELQLVWHSGREAGFRYTDTRNLRGQVDDPRLQHVRSYWAADRLKSGLFAPKDVFGRRR